MNNRSNTYAGAGTNTRGGGRECNGVLYGINETPNENVHRVFNRLVTDLGITYQGCRKLLKVGGGKWGG